jgi:hypothetical protein
MTIVRIALQVLLRTAILVFGLVAYDRVYDQAVPATPGDADIGKGLLAFLLIMVVSIVWAFVDGLRHRPLVWLVVWVVTAAGVGFGWDPVARLFDESREDLETGIDLFFAQLVLIPALIGAGFAWLISYRTRTRTPA